jgi:hypothetical protein
VLFLYAAGDPERVRTRSGELAARLAGLAQAAPGETYGDFRQGTAVRQVEVPGADHMTIVWSDVAVAETIRWLDLAFGAEPRALPETRDPRFPVVALLGALVVLVLPGLGLLIGRLTPTTEHLPASRRPLGLLLLAAALVVSMPLAATGAPGAIFSVEVGDIVAVHFALAGLALLVALHLRDSAQFASLFATPGRSLLGAGLGLIGVYLLLQPLGVIFHRLAPTPERLAVFAGIALALLPFELAMQTLLRRGRPLSAALYAAGGRALVVLVMILGVATGVLPAVVALMLPALVLVFVMIEIVAASVYVASRNLLAIALLDAGWIAWVVAAIMPIRI